MAGSIVFTYEELRTVRKVVFDWLSDASGDVSGNLSKALFGIIERVVFVPDGGGTAPTTLYDLVLNDVDGADVVDGVGADLSATVTASVGVDLTGGNAAIAGTLDLVVSNAGNAKGGKVILYIR